MFIVQTNAIRCVVYSGYMHNAYVMPVLLNVATTGSEQTKRAGTENDWITVESKKEKRQAKRIVSCLTDDKTRNVHGNVEAKGKRVRFGKE
jgi:hypothetical protein